MVAKASGVEFAWTAEPMPIAAVYRGGRMTVGSQEAYAEFEPPMYRGGQCFPASEASLAGKVLTVRFAQAKVTATYQVTVTPHYLAFQLQSLTGEPIDRIDLLQFRLKRLPYLGPWINVVTTRRTSLTNFSAASGVICAPHRRPIKRARSPAC